MKENVRKWATLIGTGISALFVGVDFTIVNTALASIQSALHTDMSELQWVMAGFGLTFCTFLVSMGRLGDLLGRRLLLYIGVIGFGFSSLGSGLAQTPLQLIIFRILQGAFSAIIFPCGLALTSNVFPKNQQGKAIGLYTSVLGIGFAIGPVLGGFLVSWASWRWIFLINLPVVCISLLICFFSLRESRMTEKVHIDWWGMTLITIALGTAVFAITQGPDLGWSSISILSCFAISLMAAITLAWVETKIAEPLIPFHLLNNYGFLIGIILFIITLGFSWTVAFFAPLYLQNIIGFTPHGTGLMFLIMTTMTFVVPGITGAIYDKYGLKISVHLVFALAFLSAIFMLFFQINGPIWIIILGFLAYGSAWGAANGVAMPICLSEHNSDNDTGLISGAAITLFNIFGILVFSIIGTLFTYIEKTKILGYLTLGYLNQDWPSLTPPRISAIHAFVVNPQNEIALLSQFSPKLIHQIYFYYRQSFIDAFHVAALIMLITVVICALIVYPSLRRFENSKK